jgi:hypothetical protein
VPWASVAEMLHSGRLLIDQAKLENALTLPGANPEHAKYELASRSRKLLARQDGDWPRVGPACARTLLCLNLCKREPRADCDDLEDWMR